MPNPPARIFLQWEDDSLPEGVTWCVDQINESDVEYVRAPSQKHIQEAQDIANEEREARGE